MVAHPITPAFQRLRQDEIHREFEVSMRYIRFCLKRKEGRKEQRKDGKMEKYR